MASVGDLTAALPLRELEQGRRDRPEADLLLDDVGEVGDDGDDGDDAALIPVPAQLAALYRPPMPGRSWRSAARFFVLVGGSGVIGVGVAAGLLTMPAAGFLAVGLATAQVIGQTWRQNRLGQSVVGGIALGDLDAAQRAAERALAESPGGVMRTLAASNLASVLIQRDCVGEAAQILDRWPPGILQMPLATILWLNNRAFAHLSLEPAETSAAEALLEEAERRLQRAGVRDLGGTPNARKLTAAVAGTRGLERTQQKDGATALASLRRASEYDDGPATAFRTIERELCRTEALRLVGRTDEATLTLESLTQMPLTERQRRRLRALECQLDLV